ncbi:MAG: Lrp/AsnC family transcriptional regulator [Pseudomonadota bacterium]
MIELDTIDRRLVAKLKLDGRASITQLAGELGLARGTVQNRIARLISTGAIRRFTVEVDIPDDPKEIEAVMLIEIEGSRARSIIGDLRRRPQVSSVYSTNGNWDLVANIRVASLSEFDAFLQTVRDLRGVLNSETCLLLNRAV